jgi:hypothetical protein
MGNFLATTAGDTPTYIEPIEHLINNGSYGMYMGEYTPFKPLDKEFFFPSIRTPHYGIFYLLFRLFFSSAISLELLAIVQIIVDAIAVMVFARLVYKITLNKTAYYISLGVMTFSAWLTFYSAEIMTETFTWSFIVFGLYFFHRWLTDKKNVSIFLSGLFIGYAILLKPFILPWLFFITVAILVAVKDLRLHIKYFTIFCVPFIVFLTPWVIRNYIISKEIILFSKPMYYPCKKQVISCGNFINAWGGDHIWWEGKCASAGTFFHQRPVNKNCEYKFPDFAFTPDYTLEDLRELRNLMARFQLNTKNDSLDEYISKRFDELTISYKKHRPFNYYVVAPLFRMKSALIKSGSYYIYPRNIPLIGMKLFQTALYWFPLFFGGIALFYFGVKRFRDPFMILNIGLPITLLIVLTWVLKMNEWRYFIHFYPILILYMLQLFIMWKNRLGLLGRFN